MSAGIAFDCPIRMAIFFDQGISAGGGYQQAVNAAVLVTKLSSDLCTPIFVTTRRPSVEALRQYGIDVHYLPMPPWRKISLSLRRFVIQFRLLRYIQVVFGSNYFDRFLEFQKVDLVYFTSPSVFSLLSERCNYLFTVWDLCHRDEVEFPEVRENREFERREALYERALKKAVAVIVDSEMGKENVVRRYGVDTGRVHVMPFAPAIATTRNQQKCTVEPLDIKAKYGLDCDYIYYPAQFWAHKNHIYLLRGLYELERRHGFRLGAIFSGGDKGNRSYIESVACGLGLADRVVYAGIVTDEEVPHLYCQSVALVMPSYFGPTNLPPLEAFGLGVPVFYSDLPGLRDQVGDGGFLMNLSDPMSMANQLYALLTQPGLREDAIARGKRRVSAITDEGRLAVLSNILGAYRQRHICWGVELDRSI